MTNNIIGQSSSILTPINFDQLTGWSTIDKTGSMKAFRRSCAQMKEDNRAFSKNPIFGGTRKDWEKVCTVAFELGESPSQKQIAHFFEQQFMPMSVRDPNSKNGLFTGYFEPTVKGSITRSPRYNIPLYKRPDDLVVFDKAQEKQSGLRYGRLMDGQPTPYFTRQEIEQGLFEGKNLELVWLKERADAFFLQIQGSGRVELTNGDTMRLAYAGKTGLPYTAIGAVLINDGELEREAVSMQTIRDWMDKNPKKSQQLMWKNQSFVFFRELQGIDSALGPVGAQMVSLTPNHSLAIDRRYWAFGTPVWLDTKVTNENSGILEPWQSLLIAQDTGSAIRGIVRGDVFWGNGKKAATIAGNMKSSGTMIVLLPKKLAKSLID